MAKTMESGPGVGVARFKMVMRAPKILRGRAARGPCGALVSPSGVTDLNVAATELLAKVARANGIEPEQYAAVFGGDEATRQIGCWIVDPKTLGATAVRQNPVKKTVTLYLSEVFVDMPDLQPSSSQWCAITEANEAQSNFIVISMGVALDRRRIKRKVHAVHPVPAGM